MSLDGPPLREQYSKVTEPDWAGAPETSCCTCAFSTSSGPPVVRVKTSSPRCQKESSYEPGTDATLARSTAKSSLAVGVTGDWSEHAAIEAAPIMRAMRLLRLRRTIMKPRVQES